MTIDNYNNNIVISLISGGKYFSLLKKLGIKVYCINIKFYSIINFFYLIKLLRTLNPDVVQTWLILGDFIGGIAATFLFEGIEHDEEHRWTSIGFMIILFLVTCVIAKGMKINFPRSDRKKIVTTGIGSFIFLYLFAWIMSFTLLNLPQENISIIPGL